MTKHSSHFFPYRLITFYEFAPNPEAVNLVLSQFVIVVVYCCVGGTHLIFLLWVGSKHIFHYTSIMIRITKNEIARRINAKRTKTLVDEMRSKAYELAILNVMRQIKYNNDKTPYGILGLTERGLAEVGLEVSSDAIRKQVKKEEESYWQKQVQ